MFTAYWKMRKQRRLRRDVTFVTSSDISGSFLTLVQQRWTELHFTMQRSFASLTVLGAGDWSFGRFFAGRGGMSLLDVTSGCDGKRDACPTRKISPKEIAARRSVNKGGEGRGEELWKTIATAPGGSQCYSVCEYSIPRMQALWQFRRDSRPQDAPAHDRACCGAPTTWLWRADKLSNLSAQAGAPENGLGDDKFSKPVSAFHSAEGPSSSTNAAGSFVLTTDNSCSDYQTLDWDHGNRLVQVAKFDALDVEE